MPLRWLIDVPAMTRRLATSTSISPSLIVPTRAALARRAAGTRLHGARLFRHSRQLPPATASWGRWYDGDRARLVRVPRAGGSCRLGAATSRRCP